MLPLVTFTRIKYDAIKFAIELFKTSGGVGKELMDEGPSSCGSIGVIQAEQLSCAEVAVLIVGFRNSQDILNCLRALSRAAFSPSFDVFICENGGAEAYRRLIGDLLSEEGPSSFRVPLGIRVDPAGTRFTRIQRLSFRSGASNVWIGCAVSNLGYAGGINAWLLPLSDTPGWKGVWILNPDTEPSASALAALYERAESGRKAMVGSTLVDNGDDERVRIRGGMQWQKARAIAIGRGERLGASCNIAEIERAMDSPSGASMYVTRWCIERIGLMDERYFLFYEDLDWGVRAKSLGLGYARDSIVIHKRGTTTGSAKALAAIPRPSVYLEHRNGVHLVRRHFPSSLALRVAISLMYAIRFLIRGAPNNSLAVVEGLIAGLKGEIGLPGEGSR
ncbi:glycosyltransferase family 2 protein [Bradyrhizobium vignae]|uniref:glycosyltransferase family 2 protein n=1 Tax=Bradyrhizobium vignae TaxID=1549949 RepID=UPI00100B9678|nr:glycosyltransferase family 2 protein [Bradyrhizobium vignae]RXG91475.1 glycosyltransferase family 2 protein [Bradyrhizobium vignae]